MNAYEHSVFLDKEKCTGCTTCIRHCPTEAIRIKNNRAVIKSDKGMDCGACIRYCPHQAKSSLSSKFAFKAAQWTGTKRPVLPLKS